MQPPARFALPPTRSDAAEPLRRGLPLLAAE